MGPCTLPSWSRTLDMIESQPRTPNSLIPDTLIVYVETNAVVTRILQYISRSR